MVRPKPLLHSIEGLSLLRARAVLCPFLQGRLGVTQFRFQGSEQFLPITQHKAARRIQAAVQIDRRNHGLAGSGEDGALAPPAAS